MIERTAVIASRVGLHARPAAILAQAVASTGLDVTIGLVRGPLEEAVDASSVLGLMSLGAVHGGRVVLRTDAPAAGEALATLVAVLETDHDAE